MNSNKKMLGLLIVIVIVVIIIICTIIILMSKKSNNVVGEATGETHIESVENKKVLEKVTTRRDLYIAKNCIKTFYTYYSNIYNIDQDVKIVDEDTIASNEKLKQKYIQKIYNILDDEYVSENNITISNLESKLEKIEKITPDITELYIYKKTDNIALFIVKGNLLNTTDLTSSEFEIILKADLLNRTFSILLDDYVQENFKNVVEGEAIDEAIIGDSIENKEDNVFSYENVTDETYIRDIFDSLKKNLLCNKEEIYNKLDEEYRKNKFENVSEFEEYIKNNLKDVSIMTLSKYQKNQYEKYTEYVCIDKNNNYYIINAKNSVEYTIMLDIYTLNIDAFKEKYDSASDYNKAGLNFEKVKQALTKKDYKYIYNLLNEEFKQNNFDQYSKFENYMKENLGNRNVYNYEDVEDKQTAYVAIIEATNSSDKSLAAKKLTIILQLNDNYDFEISLSIE